MSADVEGDGTDGRIDVQAFVESVLDSYRYMEMSVERYALLVLLPGVTVSLGVGVAIAVFDLPVFLMLPMALIAVLAPLAGFVYPKILAGRRRREIRGQFHLFLTHITVLSMTNIERVEVFRTLAQVEEYGALAEEMGRITALVDTWNQSLDDACRRRSRHISSDLLADFFERLAYTVGAGQGLDDFLVGEQESIIQEFVIQYESDLSKLDVMKDLYLSMMMSATFILVFSTVVPLLIGVSSLLLVGGVIILLGIIQGGFLFAVHTVAPDDPVWLTSEEGRSPVTRVRRPLALGVVLSVVLIVGVVVVGLGYTPLAPDTVPRPIYLAIPTTPLLIPGLALRRQEQRVKSRDNGFPSFVRALGSVESVKQTSTANVLESLRRKDFGALTANVDNLYKRLRTRIDTADAWRLFAAETGSYLIQKFGDMYVVGRRMGGEPRELGQVISTNFNQVLRVREQRQQATTTFIGVLYGVTAAAIFSSFIGLSIAEQMLTITEEIASQNSEFLQSLFSTASYDVDTIELLLLGVVLLNAIVSSLMIRVMDRGHFLNALPHFVLLTWCGAAVASVTKVIVGGIL